MKITNEQLRQIIKEELEAVLNEAYAGQGETTGLSGRTGYAKSKQQKDLERDAKARQSQHYDNQEAGERAYRQQQADKKQAAKDRAAPGKRSANIREMSKFVVKDTISDLIGLMDSDFGQHRGDRTGFFKALKKISGMTEKDFINKVEETTEAYMTKKNITQLQDRDMKKIANDSAFEIKQLIKDAKKKARNRTFMQKAGSFLTGKGFKQ